MSNPPITLGWSFGPAAVEPPRPPRLIRAPTINVETVIDTKNIFELIQETLSNFGLSSLILENNDSIKKYYNHIVSDISLLIETVGIFEGNDEVLTYKRKKYSGEEEIKQYEYIKYLNRGGNNTILLYKDENRKEYIVRKSINTDGAISSNSQYLSFYENIKHLILYILIRKFIGNIKLVPQPYHLGFRILPHSKIEVLMVMEKANLNLEEFIANPETPIEEIREIFLKIYQEYYLLNNLRINFKHNDFKCNNILLTDTKSPMIIDFGNSTFTITDREKNIEFKSNSEDSHFNYNPETFSGYGIIHDMLQLITSTHFVNRVGFNPYTIFTFVNNLGSNILDGNITKCFLENYLPRIEPKKYFHYFYNDVDFSPSINLQPEFLADKVEPGVTVFITPEELAHNLNIKLKSNEELFDNYEKKYFIKDLHKNFNPYKAKYLKYKYKYINLKKKLIKI
jgi:hypothetical protein